MTDPVDVLVLAAHPDDAEIGCGGVLLLEADAGSRCAVADLTAGELATNGTPEERAGEREIGAKILGLVERRVLGLPDGRVGTERWHRDAVIALIRELRPRIVLAPYSEDRHPDHEAAGRLVREACFFAGVAKAGAGAPHRPEHLYHYMIHHPLSPSFVVDVTAVWERKRAAIEAHASQFFADGTEIGAPDFLAFIDARAVFYGAMIGVARGEAFSCTGPVPLWALPGLGRAPGRPTYSVYR